jgi:secreted PhoX family phosphatase
VLVCPTDADRVRMPQRVVGYGRFEHEAATVDPATMIAYLTEDKGDSCFYRFEPTRPDAPFAGKLQALRVVGRDRFQTGTGNRVGDSWAIDWVDVDQPDPGPSDPTTRSQGQSRGAAIVVRGEGLWIHDGSVYFVSTSGGPVAGGQIFRLDPRGDGGTLTLIAQSASRDVLDKPDNQTVAPWDDIVVAEDGSGEQFLRIVHPDGSITDFARNAGSASEFAGVCFSPDGKALFVNIQGDGLTLVITGPFPTVPGPLPDAGVDAPPPPPDAGVDAGAPDAGTVADAGRPDAAPMPPDAGAGDGGGGGCQASEGAGAATAALVAAVAIGRAKPANDCNLDPIARRGTLAR